jgi:hypothetical protein
LNKQCDTYTPKLEEIAYERLIDVKDSYYPYGSKNMRQLFSETVMAQNYGNQKSIELEVSHPQCK